MSMCRVFSCVVGRGCLLWPVGSLGKTLLAFALLHSVLQGQLPVTPGVLDFLLLHSSPLWWKGRLFFILIQHILSLMLLQQEKISHLGQVYYENSLFLSISPDTWLEFFPNSLSEAGQSGVPQDLCPAFCEVSKCSVEKPCLFFFFFLTLPLRSL